MITIIDAQCPIPNLRLESTISGSVETFWALTRPVHDLIRLVLSQSRKSFVLLSPNGRVPYRLNRRDTELRQRLTHLKTFTTCSYAVECKACDSRANR